MKMTESVKLSKKDFVAPADVRWCPGCGDYSILNALQKTLPEIGIQRENIVVVSGIGCSSRFPYYMNTYGFHTIHGRAPTVATGVKVTNPDLSVWMITGDGDALSIGGNHFMHLMRRNVDINVLLFNNEIYGLTKGQYSPTSEQGTKTKTSPMGSIDHPINPISLALAAEATFVARTSDGNPKHMNQILKAAASHKGCSFVEILQNCVIFNDKTFEDFLGRSVRDDNTLVLEEGKPLIFGKDRDKGVKYSSKGMEMVNIGEDGITLDDIVVHDPRNAPPGLTYAISRLRHPEAPVPMGVFKSVENRSVFEDMLVAQIDEATKAKGEGDLQKLLTGNGSWDVYEGKKSDRSTVTRIHDFASSEEQTIMSELEKGENAIASDPLLGALNNTIETMLAETETFPIATVSSEESLDVAIKLLLEKKIGCLPVIEDGKVLGILSERDITLKVMMKNIDLEFTPVSAIMSKDPTVLNTQNTVSHAISAMSAGSFRHLPVTDEEGNLQIVSVKGLMRYMSQKAKS